jgi:hypothetical protein
MQRMFQTPEEGSIRSSSRHDDGDEYTRRRWGGTEETETSTLAFQRLVAAAEWEAHQDLGMHLMNAHVLKKLHPNGDPDKKMREKSKDKPSKKQHRRRNATTDDTSGSDDEADYIPLNMRRFVTNQWTAWPLDSQHVPRENEYDPKYRRDRPREAIPDEKQLPSQMLEDVLTAVAVRQAKNKIREEGKVELKPAIDDDESQKLLRPIVRNIISKLDNLLQGLHQEREHYFKNLIPSSAGGDAKRKWDQLKAEAKAQEEDGQHPNKAISMDSEDLEEEYESEGTIGDGENKKKRKRKIAKPEDYAKYLQNRRYRVRLRDWSQVVGMAAIKGWEQGPLERTAAKCVELFGQDMKFRTLGRNSKRGIEWSAKDGLSKDLTRFEDEGSFLEEVRVSGGWGHQKKQKGGTVRKDRNRNTDSEESESSAEEEEEEEDGEEGHDDN